jgi:pyruvate/2-oxoglutarate dehydrogenase complex dihydrolipoamide acyltransferase (E2) component
MAVFLDLFGGETMPNPETGHGPTNGSRAAKATGRRLGLSGPRRVMCDLLAVAKTIPTVPVQSQINVANVAAARARVALASDPPGWCAIFTKAYAITALRFPELRRAYLSLPRPVLYEHPHSIASIAIERQHQGENAVFWGHLRRPDQKSLRDLQALLVRYKNEPIRNFGLFRRTLLMGRLPWLLRRMAWWLALNIFGGKRAGFLGTFGVSVYSGLGAESLHPISPLTTTLTYGTIMKDGTVSVRIVYDHRVMDGATVARALAYLGGVLNREIVQELEQEAQARAG